MEIGPQNFLYVSQVVTVFGSCHVEMVHEAIKQILSCIPEQHSIFVTGFHIACRTAVDGCQIKSSRSLSEDSLQNNQSDTLCEVSVTGMSQCTFFYYWPTVCLNGTIFAAASPTNERLLQHTNMKLIFSDLTK